jgi:hypothetical protein
VLALIGAGSVVAATRLEPEAATRSLPSATTTTDADAGLAAPGRSVAGEVRPTAAAGWVKAENARPGSSGWALHHAAAHGEVEGYADHVSVNAGEAVTLYVSTAAPTFRVEAYRMGWYNGLGGRLVWQSADLAGFVQARPTVTPVTNMVEARWLPSVTVTTAGWPEGDYLFKLVASTGKDQYVPLTVRDDASTAPYLLVNSVTTWQAYNLWGGYDLYEGLSGRGSDYYHRARVVSFDRPYLIGFGSGDFLGNEFPLVSLIESLGLDVSYLTSVDLDEHPAELPQHRAVFSLGHDEYYSASMRQAIIDARDQGVNLAFMGANAMFRHIRFAPSPLGPDRHEICYKSASEDPLSGQDNADVTVSWRDPPTNEPESMIIGVQYQCNPVNADLVITDASNWLFAGTGLRDGDQLTGVVGPEYDSYGYAHPPGVEILARSPVTCGGNRSDADASYYSAPSGAGVFASGTIWWISHLIAPCGKAVPCASTALVGITRNLLAAFGAGPAGLVHPSVPNSQVVPATSIGSSTQAPPTYRVQPVAPRRTVGPALTQPSRPSQSVSTGAPQVGQR